MLEPEQAQLYTRQHASFGSSALDLKFWLFACAVSEATRYCSCRSTQLQSSVQLLALQPPVNVTTHEGMQTQDTAQCRG